MVENLNLVKKVSILVLFTKKTFRGLYSKNITCLVAKLPVLGDVYEGNCEGNMVGSLKHDGWKGDFWTNHDEEEEEAGFIYDQD